MSLSSAPAEDSIGALYHQLPDSKAHMSKLLDGKVAIVTGASREIGAAMAELLAMHGCAVLAAHFGETDRAEALAERIRANGGRILIHDADLSRVAANQALIARAVVHLQETFSDVVKTDKTGLSKTAHTRWMISAFANFLPGSTIFRLA